MSNSNGNKNNDAMKAIIDMLSATKGVDPLELSPEEAAVAAKLLAKIAAPPDLVRQGLGTMTGEAINLLLDATCDRPEESGTLDLIRQSTSLLFQAWIEEEGEDKVGQILGAFYNTFDERYKGSPENLIEKGKGAIMWLINELDVAEFLTDNPLLPGGASEVESPNPF